MISAKVIKEPVAADSKSCNSHRQPTRRERVANISIHRQNAVCFVTDAATASHASLCIELYMYERVGHG